MRPASLVPSRVGGSKGGIRVVVVLVDQSNAESSLVVIVLRFESSRIEGFG